MTIKAVPPGYTGEREDNMSRVEIMKNVINDVRFNIKIANSFKKENNIDLYINVLHTIKTKLYFLFEIKLITFQQYQWLSRKIIKDSQ